MTSIFLILKKRKKKWLKNYRLIKGIPKVLYFDFSEKVLLQNKQKKFFEKPIKYLTVFKY